MTGHGGWPMTVLPDAGRRAVLLRHLLPAGAAAGMPSFRQVLDARRQAWTRRGDEVLERGRRRSSRQLADDAAALPPVRCGRRRADRRGRHARWRRVRPAHGGFGGAPKFPPSMVLEFLLRHHAAHRLGRGAVDGRPDRCEAMARGGMYDQLAGGFARYCVDAAWVVPHFEKMLYDNALLLRVYTHWRAARPGAALARRVADGDRGVPAARTAHRRGRVRLLAGRRHRRASRA